MFKNESIESIHIFTNNTILQAAAAAETIMLRWTEITQYNKTVWDRLGIWRISHEKFLILIAIVILIVKDL